VEPPSNTISESLLLSSYSGCHSWLSDIMPWIFTEEKQDTDSEHLYISLVSCSLYLTGVMKRGQETLNVQSVLVIYAHCHCPYPSPLPPPAGLSIDGLYRVSGNLAVIQKLRFAVNHGRTPLCPCLITCLKHYLLIKNDTLHMDWPLSMHSPQFCYWMWVLCTPLHFVCCC